LVDVVERVCVAIHVLGRREDGRVTPLVQSRAAGKVEGQTETEADTGLHLPHALENLLGGQEIDAAKLVVIAPITPRRSGWAFFPPLRHDFSFWSDGYEAYEDDRGMSLRRLRTL
jgi:hypothetical protein